MNSDVGKFYFHYRTAIADNLREDVYRSDGRFWPVDLCCAVVRRKSACLRLVSMRSSFKEDPIYLQYVIIHSAKGGKMLRMACRRILSSTPP
jgi:hypothetical protein